MNRTAWLPDRRMQKLRDVWSRREREELSAQEAGEILGCSERMRWATRGSNLRADNECRPACGFAFEARPAVGVGAPPWPKVTLVQLRRGSSLHRFRREHFQSGLRPATFTTLAHFSVSAAMNLPKSAGEPANAP
jgi:hypothetical protein